MKNLSQLIQLPIYAKVEHEVEAEAEEEDADDEEEEDNEKAGTSRARTMMRKRMSRRGKMFPKISLCSSGNRLGGQNCAGLEGCIPIQQDSAQVCS